jgi:hypothetical protein
MGEIPVADWMMELLVNSEVKEKVMGTSFWSKKEPATTI